MEGEIINIEQWLHSSNNVNTEYWFNPQLFHKLEKGMTTHSSILSWRIPWTEEPGGLQSTGSQRVRHDWATFTLTLCYKYIAGGRWGRRENKKIESSTITVIVTQSCLTLCTPWTIAHQVPDFPGKNTGVSSRLLLQGIFPTQGSNPHLPYYRWIFYCLSHQGSPRILEWVAMPSLQGIFPTQGSSPGLPHCRQIIDWATRKANGKPNTRK